MKGRKWHLGKNKKVFDTECFVITKALEDAVKKHGIVRRRERIEGWSAVIVGVDSTSVIRRIIRSELGKRQVWARQALNMASELNHLGVRIELVWRPAHIGIEGNERPDHLAKRAAENMGSQTRQGHTWRSLINIRRAVEASKTTENHRSLETMNRERHYHSSGSFDRVEIKRENSLDRFTG